MVVLYFLGTPQSALIAFYGDTDCMAFVLDKSCEVVCKMSSYIQSLVCYYRWKTSSFPAFWPMVNLYLHTKNKIERKLHR